MMGGYFALTIDDNPVNGLFFQLDNGLYQTPASSVHLFQRRIDGAPDMPGHQHGRVGWDTWCTLPTGQLAYFLSDSGTSKSARKGSS